MSDPMCYWSRCPNKAYYAFNDLGIEFDGRDSSEFGTFYLCKPHAKIVYKKLNENVRRWLDDFSVGYEFDGVPKGRVVNDER